MPKGLDEFYPTGRSCAKSPLLPGQIVCGAWRQQVERPKASILLPSVKASLDQEFIVLDFWAETYYCHLERHILTAGQVF